MKNLRHASLHSTANYLTSEEKFYISLLLVCSSHPSRQHLFVYCFFFRRYISTGGKGNENNNKDILYNLTNPLLKIKLNTSWLQNVYNNKIFTILNWDVAHNNSQKNCKKHAFSREAQMTTQPINQSINQSNVFYYYFTLQTYYSCTCYNKAKIAEVKKNIT